jgi:hypothetical protein
VEALRQMMSASRAQAKQMPIKRQCCRTVWTKHSACTNILFHEYIIIHVISLSFIANTN